MRFFHRAFTLVELLIVIVIIAVLAAIVIPKFSDQSRRSKEGALRSDLHLLRNGVALFHGDTGLYPATLDDLTLGAAPATGLDETGAAQPLAADRWHGPYFLGPLAADPVSRFPFAYTPGGQVRSSASGPGLDGTDYGTW